MDTRRLRRSDSLVILTERRSSGKCQEATWDWPQKQPLLKLLMIFMGLSVLVLPLFLTGSTLLHQHLNEFSKLASPDLGRRNFDNTLGGLLLPPGVFKNQCASRSEEYLLRNPSTYDPSLHLILKLREYERRHQKCAQEATRFNPTKNATEQDFGECRFVVWIAESGLGNRIVTLTSAFVYALLTDRVLLIDQGQDVGKLLCEPFPNTSWLLPERFPHEWIRTVHLNSSYRFGYLIRNRSYSSLHNGYAYLNLMHDYDDEDRKFFCADCQVYLKQFPWLFLRSNNYFLPGLHFAPEFHAELDKLFPDRETAFHHISRYLLHPSDSVWGLVLRFYNTYLASARHKVGVQVRVLSADVKFSTISDMILSCVTENKLLPNVTLIQDDITKKTNPVSLLIASLHQFFYERVRRFYLDNPTTDGQYVGVHTASHEEQQSTDLFDHDKRALADMYLLSFSDTLITSSWSTFGYVAQGVSGVTPWILTKLDHAESAEEVIRTKGPCSRGICLEPCFHAAPMLDCDHKGWGQDPSKVLPFIQHCEDVWWGIKIMGRPVDTN